MTSITGPAPFGAAAALLGAFGWSDLALQNPDPDPFPDALAFDFDADLEQLDDTLGPLYNAVDPDLSRFRQLGGKLLIYHGWSDALVPPRGTVRYYRRVVRQQSSLGETQRFARLFMAPGMQHCIGGTGPWQFDAVSALEAWVERGKAPQRIVAVEPQSGRSRPLCPYPEVARYQGAGSIEDAASFRCEEPRSR